MKNGEYYGALLGRLNRDIAYFDISNMFDNIGVDKHDIVKMTIDLCHRGLARKINDYEYELVCDISQLRDFVMEKQNEEVAVAKTGEYSEDAEKPISLVDIASADWSIKKTEKKPDGDVAKDRMRERRAAIIEKKRSASDDDCDDDDDEVSDEASRVKLLEEIKLCVAEMPEYNKETDTLLPTPKIYFPGETEPLSLGYGVDKEGDGYLTDKGRMYSYLLSKMPQQEDECSLDLIGQLLRRLIRPTAFDRSDNEIVNTLDEDITQEYITKEMGYYFTEYKRYFETIGWITDCERISYEEYKKSLDEKAEKFVADCADGKISLKAEGSGSVSKSIIYKIFELDARVTKDEAAEIALMLKERLEKLEEMKSMVVFLDSASKMLKTYSVATYNTVKIEYFRMKNS